ncbi:MAG: HEAT repeat domain-containing protein [Elusimicrobia bacterium]|nr:HEAT repeat domain-containing protein [Elusimicrobiota bacterium]
MNAIRRSALLASVGLALVGLTYALLWRTHALEVLPDAVTALHGPLWQRTVAVRALGGLRQPSALAAKAAIAAARKEPLLACLSIEALDKVSRGSQEEVDFLAWVLGNEDHQCAVPQLPWTDSFEGDIRPHTFYGDDGKDGLPLGVPSADGLHQMAVQAAARLGAKNPAALPLLERALESKEYLTRREAAVSLWHLKPGFTPAYQVLIEMMGVHDDFWSGPYPYLVHASSAVIPLLLEAMEAGHKDHVRAGAIDVLSERLKNSGPGGLTAPMRSALAGTLADPWRPAAPEAFDLPLPTAAVKAAALGILIDHTAEAEKGDHLLPHLLKALKDPALELRSEAVRGLGTLAGRSAPAEAALLGQCGGKEAGIRQAAASALAVCATAACRASQLKALDDADTEVVLAAASGLYRTGSSTPAALGALRRLLARGADGRRMAFVLYEWARERPGDIPLDLPLRFLGKDLETASTAISILGTLGPRARSALGEILAVSRARRSRFQSYEKSGLAHALRGIGVSSPEVLAVLQGLLEETDSDARMAAAAALGVLGADPAKSLEVLTHYLRSDLHPVVCDALENLAALGPLARPTEPLVRDIAEKGPTEYQRMLARKALAAMAP